MNVRPFQLVTTDPLLRALGVTLEYAGARGTVRTTDDVSFDVYRGDRFVLLGPSGCGKLTLLKAVGGFIAPHAGSLLLNGQPILRPGPGRIVMFQEFDQLPPWKTVKGNVMFPLLASGMARPDAKARALHWLAKVGLSAFVDAYPHTLSGGMEARVAIARALAMQPDILLMGEPLAALDALTRCQMQEQLQALWKKIKFTMLFVTHSTCAHVPSRHGKTAAAGPLAVRPAPPAADQVDRIQRRHADEDVDQPRQRALGAEQRGHQIETEQAHQRPVQPADDQQGHRNVANRRQAGIVAGAAGRGAPFRNVAPLGRRDVHRCHYYLLVAVVVTPPPAAPRPADWQDRG